MAEAYVGEIRAFGINYPPRDWMSCNGQLLPISQYTALFSLLGTNFGGNGTTNFALPNFQGNVGVGAGTAVTGTNYPVGDTGGSAGVVIDSTTVPAHRHAFLAAGARYKADTNVPGPTVSYAPASGCTPYLPAPQNVQANMAPTALSVSGGTGPGPHNNLAPTTAMNFCICVNGQFPPRG
jgi:microcystin-dependent protein